MDEIKMQTEELAKAIRRSNEYTQYHVLWEEISKNQALKERLNEFRKERFLLDMGSDGDMVGKMGQMTKDYADILEQSLVQDFLAAEQRYSKKVRQINHAILEAVNMDVEFLDE